MVAEDKSSEPVVHEKWKDPYERIARFEERVEALEDACRDLLTVLASVPDCAEIQEWWSNSYDSRMKASRLVADGR